MGLCGACGITPPVLVAVVGCLVFMLVHVYGSLIADCAMSGKCLAEKERLSPGEPCRDLSGAVRADGDSWRSTDNQCAINVCHHGVYRNFTIRYKCKELDQRANPDKANCVQQQNLTATYPDCCPYLYCPPRAVDTVTPATCIDRATNFSCFLWKSWGGCSDGSPYYNFTSIYCQLSCSFC